MPTYCYKCPDCAEVFVELVPYDHRDEPQDCQICGLQSPRTWEQFTVNVSTEKTSQSIPAAAAKGRFDGLRRQQELKKEKAAARLSGDRTTEKKLDRELNKT